MDGLNQLNPNEALVWPPEAVTAARQAQHEAEHREYFGSDDDYEAIEWTSPAPSIIQAECPAHPYCNHAANELPEYYTAPTRWNDPPSKPNKNRKCPCCNHRPSVGPSRMLRVAVVCKSHRCPMRGKAFTRRAWHRFASFHARNCYDRELYILWKKHLEHFGNRTDRMNDSRIAAAGTEVYQHLSGNDLAAQQEHELTVGINPDEPSVDLFAR